MKAIGLFLWLLNGVQVQCHRLPRYSEDQGGQGENVPPEHQHGNELQDWEKIVPSNAEFAFRLYRQIAADPAAENILFSPLSISTALAALALGANSETRTQIYEGLAFNLSEIEENEIHRGFHQLIRMLNPPASQFAETGNALFTDETVDVQPTFLENIKHFYEAEHFSTNFLNSTVAENQINRYVGKKTQGQIPHIVKDLSVNTLMVIVNYIFFQGKWGNPFHVRSMVKNISFLDDGRTVNITLMFKEDEYRFLYDEDLFCWVVELPFEDDAAAWFVLPDKGKLQHVERTLEKEILSKWSTSFVLGEVQVSIPKFSISASYDLEDLFHRLGVTSVFDSNADFSGITGKPNLRVSEAVHEAVVVVEEKIMLTASRDIDIYRMSPPPLHPPPPTPPSISFYRPFFMFVIDRSKGTILLMGKIVNPSTE